MVRDDELGIELEPFAEAVAAVKRRVNDRLGRFTLRSGATLPLHAIYGDGSNAD